MTYEDDPLAAFGGLRGTGLPPRSPHLRRAPIAALVGPGVGPAAAVRAAPAARRRRRGGRRGGGVLPLAAAPGRSIEGLDSGAALGRSAVESSEIRVHVSGRARPGPPSTARSIGAPRDGSDYVWRLPNVADGVPPEVSADRLLFGTVSSARSFTVDSVAPVLQVPPATPAAAIDQPVTVDGTGRRQRDGEGRRRRRSTGRGRRRSTFASRIHRRRRSR